MCLYNQLPELPIHYACACVCVCARACIYGDVCNHASCFLLFSEGPLCNTLESLTGSGPAILSNGRDGQTPNET